MQFAIDKIKLNNINFKSKNNNVSGNKNSNFEKLTQYFRNNSDIYYSYPDFNLSDNLDSLKELSKRDFSRTKEMLDVVTKHLREQIRKNGKVDFEDEHYIDIQNLIPVIDCEKLTPSAFSDLLSIASDKSRNPNLNLFETIEALNIYEELKNFCHMPFEDYEIAKEDYFQDDCTLLSKDDINKLDKKSDLFKFEYVSDLNKAQTREEVINNLFNNRFKNSTIAVNVPLIYMSYILCAYNRLMNDVYAKQTYERLMETQPEMLKEYEYCKAVINNIQNDFDVKIIIPEEDEEFIPEIYADILDKMHDELCAWKQAGKDDFECPKRLEIPDGEIDEIRPNLRAYLAVYNDKKRGWNIEMTDKKDYLDDFDAVNKILNDRIYEEEFLNAGISDDLIDEAHKDTCKYISVASMGDFSKYSSEFKQVLVDFGLPKWVFNIK